MKVLAKFRLVGSFLLAIGITGLVIPPQSQAANNCEAFKNWPQGLSLLNAPKNPTTKIPTGTVQLSKTQIKYSALGPTVILDDVELTSQGFTAGSTAFFYSSTDEGKTWSCDVSYTTISNSIPTRKNGNTLVMVYLVDNSATKLAVTPVLTVKSFSAVSQEVCSEKNLKLDVFYDGQMFVAKVVDTKAITVLNDGFKAPSSSDDVNSALSNNEASMEKRELYENCAGASYSNYEIQFSINNFKTTYKYRDTRTFSPVTGETDPAIIFALKKNVEHQFRAIPVNKDRSTKILKVVVRAKDTRKFCDKPENKFKIKCINVQVK